MRLVPDRLSADKTSPFYNELLISRVPPLQVYLNDVKQDRCVEFCVSQGWIVVWTDVLNANGNKIYKKLQGKVDAFYPDMN